MCEPKLTSAKKIAEYKMEKRLHQPVQKHFQASLLEANREISISAQFKIGAWFRFPSSLIKPKQKYKQTT